MNKEDELTYSLEDLRMVPTLCERCGAEGQAPTFIQYLDDETNPISKMLATEGYVRIHCKPCAEQFTTEYLQ